MKWRLAIIGGLLTAVLLACTGLYTVRQIHPAGICSFDCGDLGYERYELRAQDTECWCLERGRWSKLW